MALVAYASSDDDSLSEKEDETSAIASLPKKREPVKISIPSLKEFAEEEKPDPIVKPKPKGGSGLFSLLPPPKNSSTFSKPGFTPYVFSKKKETKAATQNKKKTSPSAPKKSETAEIGGCNESSVIDELDEDDSSEKVDYFSLNAETAATENTFKQNKDSVVPSLRKDSFISRDSATKIPDDKDYFSNNNASSSSWIENYAANETSVPETSSSSIDWGSLEMRNVSGNSESDGPSDFLKDEKFRKLKGRKEMENIDIIDVKADDQLTGKDQWLMQSLTQETYRPMKRKHDMPTSQQKRKHQITYLAFQAKERELDLKNQWALNNRTRRETQAKYGF